MPPRRRPTKTELQEAELKGALTWPDEPPAPITTSALDRMVEEAPGGLARAWTYNAASMRISYGSFNRYDHSDDGPMGKGLFASKGIGGPWYETRADACLALRYAVTNDAANALVRVDRLIAGYLAQPDPSAPDVDDDAPGPRGR